MEEAPHEIVFKPTPQPPADLNAGLGGTAPDVPDDILREIELWKGKPRYSQSRADQALLILSDLPMTYFDAEEMDHMQTEYFSFLKHFWMPENTQLYDLDRSRRIGQEPISNLQSTFQRIEVQVENGFPIEITFGTRPGDERRLNEDSLLVSSFGNKKQLFTVFDGASSQKPIEGLQKFEWAGAPISGAFYVSHLASLEFPSTREYQDLISNPNASAYDFINGLNSWLRQRQGRVEGVDYSDVLTIPGMCATSVVVDQEKGKVTGAHVADSMAIAKIRNPETGKVEFKVITNDLNKRFDERTLGLAKNVAKDNGITIREAAGHPLVKQELKESYTEKINTPEGTGIVNGMNELIDNGLVQTFELDLDSLEAIVLATDGFYDPWLHFIESGDLPEEEKVRLFEDMFARISEMDPGKWSGKIIDDPSGAAHGILEHDPDHEKIPRIKTKDDATFMLIDFAKMRKSSSLKAA